MALNDINITTGDESTGYSILKVPSVSGSALVFTSTGVLSGDNTTFAKLDATNQPFTGNVTLSATNPILTLTTSGNSNTTRLTKVATNLEATRYNQITRTAASYALNFASTTDVASQPNALLSGTGDFSLACWVKLDSIGVTNALFGTNKWNAGHSGYGIYINSSNRVVADITNITFTGTVTTFTTGVWYHIMVVRSAGTATVYVNNGSEVSASSTGSIASVVAFFIGTISDDTTNARLRGSIQQIIVLNRAFSAGERTALYNAGTGADWTVDANTQLYLPLNEGTGSVSQDYSQYDRSVTIKGTTWVAGKVSFASSTQEVNVWDSKNNTIGGGDGVLTLGTGRGITSLYSAETVVYSGASEKWRFRADGSLAFNNGNATVVTGAGNSFRGLTAGSVLYGYANSANNGSIVFGRANFAQSSYSTSEFCTVIGNGNNAWSTRSITVGDSCTSGNSGSSGTLGPMVNIGYANSVQASNCMVLGINTNNSTGNSFKISVDNTHAFWGNTSGRYSFNDVPAAAALYALSNTAADLGLLLKGATSQSGDYLQIQNNSATVLSKIDASGNIGARMGSTALTAYLHLAAGTATASTAPLKFTSGTLLSTAEAGAVEFNTDKFYGTITTGAARKELALFDIAGTSGRVPYETTNGRLTDSANLTYDATTLTVTGKVQVTNATTTNVNLTLKQVASQTADILKAQDSSANDVARMDINGTLYTGGVGQSSITKGLIVNSGAGNAATDSFNVYGITDTALLITDPANNRVGIGVAAPATKAHIIATTEQLRLGYDTGNYLSFTVDSTGSTTLALTGTSPTFTISQGVSFSDNITLADAKNIILNTTTGTKIGTSTSQKLALWNATPVIQPTTGISPSVLVYNGGTTITDTDTFDGYTLKQIVAALRQIGALA